MRRAAIIDCNGLTGAELLRPAAGRPLVYWACAAAGAAQVDAVYLLGADAATAEACAPLAARGFAGQVADAEAVGPFEIAVRMPGNAALVPPDAIDAACALVGDAQCEQVVGAVPAPGTIWESNSALARPALLAAPLIDPGLLRVTTRRHFQTPADTGQLRTAHVPLPLEALLPLHSPGAWTSLEAVLRARPPQATPALGAACRALKFVASDVDGSLTDSGMYYAESGDELKKFNTRDGMAFHLLREAGIAVGIITAEDRVLVDRRAAKLRIGEVHKGAKDKVAVMADILARHGWTWEEVGFFGDDIGDHALLKRVAVAGCPSDAIAPVREAAHIVTEARGGHGAFREFTERLLGARGT